MKLWAVVDTKTGLIQGDKFFETSRNAKLSARNIYGWYSKNLGISEVEVTTVGEINRFNSQTKKWEIK